MSQDLYFATPNIFGKTGAWSVTTALSLKPQGKDPIHQMECLAANTLKWLVSGIYVVVCMLFKKTPWPAVIPLLLHLSSLAKTGTACTL